MVLWKDPQGSDSDDLNRCHNSQSAKWGIEVKIELWVSHTTFTHHTGHFPNLITWFLCLTKHLIPVNLNETCGPWASVRLSTTRKGIDFCTLACCACVSVSASKGYDLGLDHIELYYQAMTTCLTQKWMERNGSLGHQCMKPACYEYK